MVGSAVRRPRKKRADRYHHGDLRRALSEEAVRTIQAEGVERLTLRAVGQRLGVSRTALYRHFTDKSALLAAVAAEGFRMLRVELVEAWERGGRGPEGFDAMGLAYVRFGITAPVALPRHVRRVRRSGRRRSGTRAGRHSRVPGPGRLAGRATAAGPGHDATTRCSSRCTSGRSFTASRCSASMAACTVRTPTRRI